MMLNIERYSMNPTHIFFECENGKISKWPRRMVTGMAIDGEPVAIH